MQKHSIGNASNIMKNQIVKLLSSLNKLTHTIELVSSRVFQSQGDASSMYEPHLDMHIDWSTIVAP